MKRQLVGPEGRVTDLKKKLIHPPWRFIASSYVLYWSQDTYVNGVVLCAHSDIQKKVY